MTENVTHDEMLDDTTVSTPAPPPVRVRVSPDKLAVLVSLPDPHEDLEGAASRVIAAMMSDDIPGATDTATMAALIGEACAPGEHLVDHPLISGTAPVQPRHGSLEWTVDFFAEGFETDEEKDRVNYRERAENRAVTADQVLARLWTAADGQAGIDIFGNKIAVDKPRKERLRAGKGVRIEPESDACQRFVAEVSGRLRLTDGTASIDEVYTIKGNVNLATGNIHHTGTVIIMGDIEAGCRIEADGDVLVKGLVEPSNIVCGGSLTVSGGIVGDAEHSLDVKGTVEARYLNEVTLRAGGDLRVQSQIDHCQVRTRGRVLIPQGRIAGGSVQAYKGIEVGHAGAESSSETVLIAGVDWQFEERLVERRHRVTQLQDARKKLMAALQQAASRLDNLTPAEKQVLESLRTKVQQVDAVLQRESQQQVDDGQQIIREAVREVIIHRSTHAGTVFQLGTFRDRALTTFDKPRLVALRQNKVHILPLGEEPMVS